MKKYRLINLIPILLTAAVLVLQFCYDRNGTIYLGSVIRIPQHILNYIVLGVLILMFVLDGILRKEWLFYLTYGLGIIQMINNAFDGFGGYYDYNNVSNVAVPRAIYFVSIFAVATLLLILLLHAAESAKKGSLNNRVGLDD